LKYYEISVYLKNNNIHLNYSKYLTLTRCLMRRRMTTEYVGLILIYRICRLFDQRVMREA